MDRLTDRVLLREMMERTLQELLDIEAEFSTSNESKDYAHCISLLLLSTQLKHFAHSRGKSINKYRERYM